MGPAFEGWKFLLVFLPLFCKEILSDGILGQILPDCVLGEDSVDYFLYNRKIRDGVVVDLESNEIPLDRSLSTTFLVHGFTSQANTSQYLNLTNTIMDQYDINIFSVDWKDGACTAGGISLTRIISYPSAVGNTRVVGQKMSRFIGRLIRDYGMELRNINLVGHSLGAHVVGFAGKDLQKQETGIIHHIFALDPAGPGFESNSCEDRVCSSDADFVQVFHTSYAFGMHRAVGNIDFYFNGGRNQDSCPLLERLACSHSKAIDYLNDVLRNPNCNFIGKQWDRSNFFAPQLDCTEQTCSVPGPMALQLPARGTFYVDTDDVPSFCHDRS